MKTIKMAAAEGVEQGTVILIGNNVRPHKFYGSVEAQRERAVELGRTLADVLPRVDVVSMLYAFCDRVAATNPDAADFARECKRVIRNHF